MGPEAEGRQATRLQPVGRWDRVQPGASDGQMGPARGQT